MGLDGDDSRGGYGRYGYERGGCCESGSCGGGLKIKLGLGSDSCSSRSSSYRSGGFGGYYGCRGCGCGKSEGWSNY